MCFVFRNLPLKSVHLFGDLVGILLLELPQGIFCDVKTFLCLLDGCVKSPLLLLEQCDILRIEFEQFVDVAKFVRSCLAFFIYFCESLLELFSVRTNVDCDALNHPTFCHWSHPFKSVEIFLCCYLVILFTVIVLLNDQVEYFSIFKKIEVSNRNANLDASQNIDRSIEFTVCLYGFFFDLDVVLVCAW